MNYFIIAGILLNTSLIIINRFVKRLPGWLLFPLSLLSIALMIIGLLQMK